MSKEPFLVAGSWRLGDDVIPVHHPFDGHLVTTVARAQLPDVYDAIELAERGANCMARLSRYERHRILAEISQRLELEAAEWSELITLESGKPIRNSQFEVRRAAITFRVAAEEALRFGVESLPMDIEPGARSDIGIITREPLGIIAAITPFNSPLNLVAHKVAPAIASGNAILLKPAPQTPGVALRLGRALLDAGLPPEALSILTSNNSDSSPLLEDDRVRGFTFTGSQVGWELKSRAPRKHVTLEMGGNGGLIVTEDADVEAALNTAIPGAFGSSGQRCISVRRIFVHEKHADYFTKELIARTSKLKCGDPLDSETVVGPLVNIAAAERAEEWISEATGKGARVLVGGKREGAVVLPTALIDVPADARVWCDELFAPVVSLRTFESLDDAIEQMNAGPFGLQVGVFTKDIATAQYAFKRLKFGGVLINEGPGYRTEHMPYGGTKASGFGREGIRYAMEAMTEPKMLIMNAGLPGACA